MEKKRVGMAVLGSAAVLALIGGVYAYLTAGDEKTNTLLLGDNEIEIVENYEQGNRIGAGDNIYDKKVQVKNTGNVDCYVRVYVGFTEPKARILSGFLHEEESEPDVYYSAVFEKSEEDSGETDTSGASGSQENTENSGGSDSSDDSGSSDSSGNSGEWVTTVDAASDTPGLAVPDDLDQYINEESYIDHLPDGWVYEPERQHVFWNTGTGTDGSDGDDATGNVSGNDTGDDTGDETAADGEYSAETIAKNVDIALGGWFYYTVPVHPGELTPSLFDKVRTYFADSTWVTENFDIIVYAESVQIRGMDGNLIEDVLDAEGNVIVPAWKAAWTDFLTRAYDKQIESYTLEATEADTDTGDGTNTGDGTDAGAGTDTGDGTNTGAGGSSDDTGNTDDVDT